MLEGQQCTITVGYNPCISDSHEEFECWVNGIDSEYGTEYSNECVSDFEDYGFWHEMRQEPWWQNSDHEDFFMYWDTYHAEDIVNCDWKVLETNCQAFTFSQDDDCDVYVSYSPCETDHFICESTSQGETQDCVQDFEDPSFWFAMREEQFWHEPQNLQYFDFYMFWEEFHANSTIDDDYSDYDTDCDWKDINVNCNEFSFITDECNIYVSYSSCETEYFICESSSIGEYGQEVEDCTEDFTQLEFWMAMREEMWWTEVVNQEY
jgi:hypothetical protein